MELRIEDAFLAFSQLEVRGQVITRKTLDRIITMDRPGIQPLTLISKF